jgi:biofilm PGA synthesis N-glycosyltransferase PgaC
MMFSWVVMILSTYISIYLLLMHFERGSRDESPESSARVDIVIPAYNEEKHIFQSLLSIKGLEFPREKLSVIVVDDGSSDGTLDEIKKFARGNKDLPITILRHKKNRGKAAALNTGLKFVRAPYVVTMDSDSFPDPGALKELLRYAAKNAVVTPAVVPTKSKGLLERLQAIEYVYGNYLANLLSGFNSQLVAPGPFSLFNAEILRSVGGFDETSPTEDLEIVYRLRREGYGIVMSPGARVKTDVPAKISELIRQRKRWHLGFFDVLKKYPDSVSLRTEFGTQTLLKGLFFALSIAFLVLFFWSVYEGALPVFRFFRGVGIDFIPFLQNLDLKLDLLRIDPQTLFYFAFTFSVTLAFLLVAFRNFEEKNTRITDTIIFLISYGFALSVATVLAAVSWIKGDYKW